MPMYGEEEPAAAPEPLGEREDFDALAWLLKALIVVGVAALAKGSAAWARGMVFGD